MMDGLESLRGQAVVVDLTSQFVVLGTLIGVEGAYLVLEESDVHDLRDTTTNREQYVVEARRHGIQVNRKVTRLRQGEVVCISRLDDVLA
ncbi:MAG: hypothetical protein DWH91_12415 [Planctomycetota bacterium]|nr:MAG: hypothetical protein DWH91_12415 [Planctomycetota bacterium]